MNTVVSALGICVLVVGLAQIQKLGRKGKDDGEEEEEDERTSSELDLALLRCVILLLTM